MITIIGGEYRSRRLRIPAGARVRPTASRVREAWFDILQRAIPGARVLDLFAGSGALGLEALSRGARSVDFVETNRRALAALGANVAALGAETRVTIHRAEALRFVAALGPGSYDVAFADPPYADGRAARLVELFRRVPFAAVLSIEHAAASPLAGDETRRYGDTAITFLRAP